MVAWTVNVRRRKSIEPTRSPNTRLPQAHRPQEHGDPAVDWHPLDQPAISSADAIRLGVLATSGSRMPLHGDRPIKVIQHGPGEDSGMR